MATHVYTVRVTPGTTGAEFEFYYAAAANAAAALDAVRREVGEHPTLECDDKPLSVAEVKHLGLSQGEVRLV